MYERQLTSGLLRNIVPIHDGNTLQYMEHALY
jgi:hypothetical protein